MKNLVLLVAAALCSHAAIALTPAQTDALRANILADPTLAPKCVQFGDGPFDIATAYNLPKSPTFVVWRSSVTAQEIMSAASFDWTRVDNLTVGKARIWEWIVQFGTLNVGQANIRAGIDATWSAGGDAATKAGIYAVSKRAATRAEALFANGTGSDASPAALVFEGALTPADVQAACR